MENCSCPRSLYNIKQIIELFSIFCLNKMFQMRIKKKMTQINKLFWALTKFLEAKKE